MYLRYIYFLLFLFCVQGIPAQKEYKQIKKYLKERKAAEALVEIEKLAADSCLTDDPRLYYMGVEACMIQNDTQNEKAYLKQSMDTAAFFSSTFGICNYVLRADSADQKQFQRTHKMKYRMRGAEIVRRYYHNLETAVAFFRRHDNFAEVERFSELCLKISESDLWKSLSNAPEIRKGRLAMRYAQSCYLQNKYEKVIAVQEQSLKDTLHRRLMLEYLALSYKELGDKENYENTLRLGIVEYPQYMNFFSNMLEKLLEEGRNEDALSLCDTLIARVGQDKELLYGRCLSLLALGRWEHLITAAGEILEKDKEEKTACYFVGLSYCRLASAIHFPTSINSRTYREAQVQQRKYYKAALPYLEKYRELCPDDQKSWAPLLYQVYLALNMGNKFEEIQKIYR